jgi:hypothetical protein
MRSERSPPPLLPMNTTDHAALACIRHAGERTTPTGVSIVTGSERPADEARPNREKMMRRVTGQATLPTVYTATSLHRSKES